MGNFPMTLLFNQINQAKIKRINNCRSSYPIMINIILLKKLISKKIKINFLTTGTLILMVLHKIKIMNIILCKRILKANNKKKWINH